MIDTKKCQEMTDEKIVELILKDSEYLSCIIDRYEKKLINYLRRTIFINEAEAEDVLQDVFLQTYTNLNDFDPSYKFSSWIYRITHNKGIDYLRKSKRERAHIDIDNEYNKDLVEIAKNALGIDLEVQNRETSENVHEILDTMPDDFREILVLRYLEEKDYSEISDVLQKPMGTVSVMLSRAKKMFFDKATKLNLTISDE